MSSLTFENNQRIGFRYRAYVVQDGRRKRISIWLGNQAERDATAFQAHADAIIEANTAGLPIPRATRTWLDRLDRANREKLQPILAVERSIKDLIAIYLETTAQNVASATIATRSDSLDLFHAAFASRRVRSLTPEDLQDFFDSIASGRSKSTLAKIAGHLKHFFAWLVDRRSIDVSPAELLSTTMEVGKKTFVPAETIHQIVAGQGSELATSELAIAISLARWAGIRVPSELRTLRVRDIDWRSKRITIRDAKRKCERVIPLFPELVSVLKPVIDRDPDGLVVPELSTMAGATLDSRFRALLERQQIKIWPRLFHSLRATRETELAERFGIKAASVWIGNSEAVAVKNYLLVPDSTFNQAVTFGTDNK